MLLKNILSAVYISKM